VCSGCAEYGSEPVSAASLALLARYAGTGLETVGLHAEDGTVRKEARAMLYGFTEYHLDRRIRSLPMLARGAPA